MSKAFFPTSDAGFLKSLQGDLYRRAFKKIPIWYREPVETFDFFYTEDMKQYLESGERQDAPAYVHLEPRKSRLKKYGIEDHRDLLIYFSIAELDRLSLKKPRTGCVVVIEKEYYLITDVIPQNYLGHTGKYSTLVAFGVKQKVSSIESMAEIPEPVPDKNSIFAPKNDYNFISGLTSVAHKKTFSKINVLKRSPDHSHDVFYGEAWNENWPGTRFIVDGYLNLTPQKSTLYKYGLEKQRVIMAVFSRENLKNINLDVDVDCFLIVEGEPYQVTYFYHKYFFGNTEEWSTLVVFGVKYKPSSVEEVKLGDDPLYEQF